MRYAAVLFDLDGTLLDTIDDLADSMNAVLARSGFPVHAVEAYKIFVGEGLENLVRRALPEEHREGETLREGVRAMRAEYADRWANRTRPYAGVGDLLDSLAARGVRTAVLSNKPDGLTRLCVEKLLPRRRFDAVRGEREGVPRKPDPAGALEIARELGILPSQFLFLGDTATDMKTAVSAGMFPVGAAWGFRTEDELWHNGAKAVIRSPGQLLGLLG